MRLDTSISNLVLLQFDRKVPLCTNQHERFHFNSCFELTISTQKVDVVFIKVNSTNQTLFPFSFRWIVATIEGTTLERQGRPYRPTAGGCLLLCLECAYSSLSFPFVCSSTVTIIITTTTKSTTDYVLFWTWNSSFLEHKSQTADWVLCLNVAYMDHTHASIFW